MKRHFLMLFIAAFTLAGCGQSDHDKFVSACVAEGQGKQDCACFADIAHEELSAEGFSLLADASASQDPDIIKKLPPDDATKMLGVVFQAIQKCEISGLAGP
jgi:hypothetical protein